MADTLTADQVAQFKEAFAKFDTDGSGDLSTAELGELITSLGKNPADPEIQKAIKEADADGSGSIDFNEFLTLMARALKK
uniref:EF-hand domain-containing protein n=1 Tax=Biomphalaria glabrata TaxID=6526 RepID=A0A2C9LWR8_BIOGL